MSFVYDHQKIEKKWRKKWHSVGLFQHMYFGDDAKEVTRENKYYILPQLPYPSGAGLHMGHTEGYTACDIYARYKRMKGKKVLQAIGWDAFGLPAENYAIKTNIHPRITINKAIDNFREQIRSLGISVDWDREVGSHNPDYYKFTQWFFLLMYKRGLAYRKKQTVNWCDGCKTVLANEQVEDNKCERCKTQIVQKNMEQWFLKITDYADRLIKDLDKVDWPKESIIRQREWIGRSEGAEITFEVMDAKSGNKIDDLVVFTTAHDTIFGATFAVVSPEHPFVQRHKDKISNWDEVSAYVKQAFGKTTLARQQKRDKDGVLLKNIYATNPATNKKMPIFVADYVLMGYGRGAIMAVPGHDTRDYDFAKKYGLDIVYVESSNTFVSYANEIKNNLDEFVVANSKEFSGMKFSEARPKILQKLQKMGVAKPKVEYKLHDWNVSRQRFWGAPIPILYDGEGNIHPVPEKDLPVLLPDDVDFVPTGRSPLTYSKQFQDGVEERYGKGWRREVDTLDTFMCSSWYYYRYLDPRNDKEFASKENLERWMPVDFYIGGAEHVTGHLLYSRFFTKVLYDAGYINFDEPFLMHRHQGMILGEDGRKMSKRWGNVVNPIDIVEKYGGDTARMYVMFMGPLAVDKTWDLNGVVGIRKFIARVYKLVMSDIRANNPSSSAKLVQSLNKTVKKVGDDIEKLKFNTAIAAMMEFVNAWEKDSGGLSVGDIKRFVTILAPFAPFVAEELYQSAISYKEDTKNSQKVSNEFTSVHVQLWPEYDEKLVKNETVTVVVQVNGKLKGKLENISVGASDEEVRQKALDGIKSYLSGKKVKKTVYVPLKVVNFVTD